MNLWEPHFIGWSYPIYYPSEQEYRELLTSVGFEEITVKPVTSDGSEYPNLIHDFSEAGLLPYLKRLPDVHAETFRTAWLEDASEQVTDRFSHRLYAVAVRP
jgi:hypothetical protein